MRPAPFQFSFPCSVCGSQLDCSAADIGQTTKCPDCESVVPVPQPTDEQLRQSPDIDLQSINLSDAVVREVKSVMPSSSVHRDNAAAMLAKAEQELKAEEKKQKERIGDRDLRRIFKIFTNSETVIRWIFLSVGAAVVMAATTISANNLVNDKTAIFGLLIALPTLLAAVAWLSSLGATGLALLNGAASGSETEVDWPPFSPVDTFLQSLYVLNAMMYSVMPAALLGILIGKSMGVIYTTLIVMGAVSLGLIFIFPVVLLSTLYEESFFAPYSTKLVKSLKAGNSYWVTFLQAAVVLSFLSSGAVLLWQAAGLWSSVVAGPVLSLFALIYFRTLGWLAWRCEQAAEPDESDED